MVPARTSWSTSARTAVQTRKVGGRTCPHPVSPVPQHVSRICFSRPHCPYDFRVELMPGAMPQASRIILLSPEAIFRCCGCNASNFKISFEPNAASIARTFRTKHLHIINRRATLNQ
ncbi:uncharacterized protein VP01_14308g1 [Puccinia sorghi]|uniref:Uncharacterized protein n=1 Tax=Puccinia sorghi TaxID=27349 RepID=A0A0L6VKF1_9BASI|nr:uncharacterized protein VP01_14308g1 [Puccinia sorghi]